MMLDGANQAAYAAGEALPNIIGMNFNYITTIAIAYPAVPIAILLVARSAQLRTVGKVALAPVSLASTSRLFSASPLC